MSEVSNKRFVHFEGTKQEFIDGGYPNQYKESIVFINGDGNESNNTIYTHGEYYGQGVIVEGDADNSAVLKGEYEGISNRALSQTSMAVGAGTTAGLKGWYYSKIDFTNKTITLSDNPTYTIAGTILLNGSWSSGTPNIKVDDVISIVNNSKYDLCSTVTDVSGNVIKVNTLPFTALTKDNGAMVAVLAGKFSDGYSLYIPAKPDAGIIDFGGGAFSEGGYNTMATNICAHAEGLDTHAYGQYSHTEGRETKAGYAAHAEGMLCKSLGNYSHTEGYKSIARANCAHVEGHGCQVGDVNSNEPVAIGTGTTPGQYSHAEGNGNINNAISSHVEGRENIISTPTPVDGVHVEGYKNEITESNTQYSHVEGRYNKLMAGSYGSHVEGRYNEAYAIGVHIEGDHNTATNNYEHACGVYNLSTPNITLFSVGIGTSDERKNAFEITKSGDINAVNGQTLLKNLQVTDDVSINGQTLLNDASVNTIHIEGNLITGNDNTIDNVYRSVVIGDYNTLSGYALLSQGNNNTITGNYSTCEGLGTYLYGNYSHVEGYKSKGTGNCIHIEGHGSVIGDEDVTVGSNNSPGSYSHVEGNANKTNAVSSHVEGILNILFTDNENVAKGCHIEGYNNNITSQLSYSHIEGRENLINCNTDGIHVEGYKNEIKDSSTQYSHIEGRYNKLMAGSYGSHVEGRYNEAYAVGVHIEGDHNTATNNYEHACGVYNVSKEGTRFSVGCGTSTTRKNAIAVKDNNFFIYLKDIDGKPGYVNLQEVIDNFKPNIYDENENVLQKKNIITYINVEKLIGTREDLILNKNKIFGVSCMGGSFLVSDGTICTYEHINSDYIFGYDFVNIGPGSNILSIEERNIDDYFDKDPSYTSIETNKWYDIKSEIFNSTIAVMLGVSHTEAFRLCILDGDDIITNKIWDNSYYFDDDIGINLRLDSIDEVIHYKNKQVFFTKIIDYKDDVDRTDINIHACADLYLGSNVEGLKYAIIDSNSFKKTITYSYTCTIKNGYSSVTVTFSDYCPEYTILEIEYDAYGPFETFYVNVTGLKTYTYTLQEKLYSIMNVGVRGEFSTCFFKRV